MGPEAGFLEALRSPEILQADCPREDSGASRWVWSPGGRPCVGDLAAFGPPSVLQDMMQWLWHVPAPGEGAQAPCLMLVGRARPRGSHRCPGPGHALPADPAAALHLL